MYSLILIYKTKKEERIFPSFKEARQFLFSYLETKKKPQFSFILNENNKVKYFNRR